MEERSVRSQEEEILKLLDEFRNKIKERTKNENNFVTKTDIEKL